jgi:hypothetical protein
MIRFVGRHIELHALDRFLQAPQAGLAILYGRRRVGKTALLEHWLSHGPRESLYWTATMKGAAALLRDLSQAVLRSDQGFTAPVPESFTFPSWEAALDRLGDIAEASPKPYVVVLDEFTYLLAAYPPVASVLQVAWDRRLSKIKSLRLILTGSSIGLIERHVLAVTAPLYGRASFVLQLHPLPYGTFVEVFSDWSADERVAAYAVTGGVPAYLAPLTRGKNFVQGLRDHALVPGSLYLNDPLLLLHEQLQDTAAYVSILQAIARGAHTWTDIAREALIAPNHVGYYVKNMEALRLVSGRVPVLAGPAQRRRGARYHIQDPFLRFYFRFVEPHLSDLERGRAGRAVQTIREDLRAFVGKYVFEELCRDWVIEAADAGAIDFLPETTGSYWAQTDQPVELDIVAASRRAKRLLIGEAKWGDKPVAEKTLIELITRSQRMPQVAQGWRTDYVLFARKGFTPALTRLAETRGVQLVTLVDIENQLVEGLHKHAR